MKKASPLNEEDLAAPQGFEPRYADPESAVLPLNEGAVVEWNDGQYGSCCRPFFYSKDALAQGQCRFTSASRGRAFCRERMAEGACGTRGPPRRASARRAGLAGECKSGQTGKTQQRTHQVTALKFVTTAVRLFCIGRLRQNVRLIRVLARGRWSA